MKVEDFKVASESVRYNGFFKVVEAIIEEKDENGLIKTYHRERKRIS